MFEDAGYSAKNTDRPRYQQMMARLRTGEFSHLVVWKIDRISRNLLDFAAMYEELKRLGVVFVSKNEQFDTSTAIGEAMLKIILIFAELERKMTSERVTAVMLSRANNGLIFLQRKAVLVNLHCGRHADVKGSLLFFDVHRFLHTSSMPCFNDLYDAMVGLRDTSVLKDIVRLFPSSFSISAVGRI